MIQLHGPFHILPECHLWLGLYDAPSAVENEEADLAAARLSKKDLLRWQRFRVAEKKIQFLQSRLAVRSVLREELKDEAELLQFDSTDTGRPALYNRACEETHSISLSHSGIVIAVTFARRNVAMGVDVEVIEPIRTQSLGAVVLPLLHQSGIDGTSNLNKPELLRTVWTAAESLWKSMGGLVEIDNLRVFQNDRKEMSVSVNAPERPSVQFESRLFATSGDECFPQTLVVDSGQWCGIRFRGCVTLKK